MKTERFSTRMSYAITVVMSTKNECLVGKFVSEGDANIYLHGVEKSSETYRLYKNNKIIYQSKI